MNKVGKGKRLEKLFREKIKEWFPTSLTELKPTLRFMSKDFWGVFDGLTFFPNKKKFLFWQTKSNKLAAKERKIFWASAKKFRTLSTQVVLIEKHNSGFCVSSDLAPIVYIEDQQIKKFLTSILNH